MSTAYLIIKFFHILLAITALGANLTYGVWIARSQMYPEFATIALRGVKFIDDWIANPSYVLMLPTGIAMVLVAGYSFSTHWISWAMGLWVLAIAAGYLGYTPSLAGQIRAIERDGPASPEAARLAVRGNIWAAILGVLIIAILILMVFKPA
jgi:uncharacterized membrane protein